MKKVGRYVEVVCTHKKEEVTMMGTMVAPKVICYGMINNKNCRKNNQLFL